MKSTTMSVIVVPIENSISLSLDTQWWVVPTIEPQCQMYEIPWGGIG